MLSGSHASESHAESILGETTSQDGIHMIEVAHPIEDEQTWFQYSLVSLNRRNNGQIYEDGQWVEDYTTPCIRDATLHFPVHSACLSLAKRLMEGSAKGQSNMLYGGPRSMRHLWDILLSRLWHGCPKGFDMEVSTACLPDPHNHYLEDTISMINWYPKQNVSCISGSLDCMLINLSPLSQTLSTFRELRNIFFHFSSLH
jgi:hypothetical protein